MDEHPGAAQATTDPPPDPVLSREGIAGVMTRLRAIHEREHLPDEGLRERKKRLTRQLISDTATWMFCLRGFENVRVSEVAAEAGVSEKTVFNYFPTKESLVFDREDDIVAGLRDALTTRAADVSPTQAVVAFVERESESLGLIEADFYPVFLAFMRMVDGTPALQIARQAIAARLVEVAREALARSADVDPRDPEPHVAAHALVGLWEIQLRSRARHVQEGTPAAEIRDAVLDDVRRAARLLDTGLWSLDQVATPAGAQAPLTEAVRSANEARRQVFEALRQARAAWAELRSRDNGGRSS